jgi:hypothetical protein
MPSFLSLVSFLTASTKLGSETDEETCHLKITEEIPCLSIVKILTKKC